MSRWLKVYVKVVKKFLEEKKIDEAEMEEKFPFRILVDDETSDDDSSDAEGEGEGSDKDDEGEKDSSSTGAGGSAGLKRKAPSSTTGNDEEEEEEEEEEREKSRSNFAFTQSRATMQSSDCIGTPDTQVNVVPGPTDGEGEGLHGVRSRHFYAGSSQPTDESEGAGWTSGFKRRKIS